MNFMQKSAAALALTCALTCPAAASVPDDFISVSVNGKILYLDQAPVLKSGTTLVPMRGIFEALGANIKWDSATRTVLANTASEAELAANPAAPNTKISLTINAPSATVNGQNVPLLAPAQIISGNTMVPLRFVGEAMGAKVKWDGAHRIIRVASPGNETLLEAAEQPASTWDLADLARIQVGGQGGILKIMTPDLASAAYTRTDDSYTNAAYKPDERVAIINNLGISQNELDDLSVRLLCNYVENRKNNTKLAALLGALCGDTKVTISQENRSRVMSFLVNKLQNGDPKLDANSSNVLKRQSLLALALAKHITPEAAEAVVKFYETCDNNYCTSPITFFCRQHAAYIKTLPNGDSLLSRISSVQSLYSGQVQQAITKALSANSESGTSANTAAPVQTAAPASAAPQAQPLQVLP